MERKSNTTKVKLFTDSDIESLKILLKDNEIHLWKIHWKYHMNDALIHSVLTSEEKERANKFKYFYKRQQFIVARGLVKILGSKYLDCKLSDMEIGIEDRGKPYFKNIRESLEFNISHSRELVVLGFAKKVKIGVDVEKHRKTVDYKKIAELFSEKEKRIIQVKDDYRYFFNVWTAREAAVKCTGEGLNYKLDNSVFLENKKVSVFSQFRKKIKVMNIDIEEGYSASLAIKKEKR